jgi:hypothetical protein
VGDRLVERICANCSHPRERHLPRGACFECEPCERFESLLKRLGEDAAQKLVDSFAEKRPPRARRPK